VGVDLTSVGHDRPVVVFEVCYSGPVGEAERVIAPLRKLGTAVKDELAPVTYLKIQGSADTPDASRTGAYVKGGLVYGITPALIDTMVGFVESTPSNSAEIELWSVGGAISRVPPKDMAYWGRGASDELLVLGVWPGAGRRRATHYRVGAARLDAVRAADARQLREPGQHR